MLRPVLSTILLVFAATTPGLAIPLTVTSSDSPGCDAPTIDGTVHELGTSPFFFSEGEGILSGPAGVEEAVCLPGTSSVVVEIFNPTLVSWTNLHYVADPDTTMSNVDGVIVPSSPLTFPPEFFGPPEPANAFKIDNVGLNTPLLFESMTPNLIFEPGETWVFAIQDYSNSMGVPPESLASVGVGSHSESFPPNPPGLSSGSIIAQLVPEPVSGLFLAAAAVTLVAVGRRRGLQRRRGLHRKD
jgi:hypothetical protein